MWVPPLVLSSKYELPAGRVVQRDEGAIHPKEAVVQVCNIWVFRFCGGAKGCVM